MHRFSLKKNDWLIVSGKRAGPVTAETNRRALNQLFGRRKVVNRDVDSGEGPEPATVVYPKNSTTELERIAYRLCIRMLRPSLNGGHFAVENWNTDAGGNITSWQGGRLRGEFGDNGDYLVLLNLYFQVSLRKEPTPQQKQYLSELDRLKRPPPSSDAAFPRLNPTVARMIIFFNG